MALLDDARMAIRATSTMTDPELVMQIEAAKADMRRAGVRDFLLREDRMEPLCKNAVILYVKAHYGLDNPDAARYGQWYQSTLASILNSSMNECDRPFEPHPRAPRIPDGRIDRIVDDPEYRPRDRESHHRGHFHHDTDDCPSEEEEGLETAPDAP